MIDNKFRRYFCEKIEELEFVAKDKETGEEYIFGFEDLYGYESEESGIFLNEPNICISRNSGNGFSGMNPNLEILLLDEANKN